MPRTTRAALRSKELVEEETIAVSVPLPTTPQKERVPLGEIADNKGGDLIMIESAENEPAKQASKKGRKAKGAKKGNSKEKRSNTENPQAEVLEDDKRSSTSSAADEACEMLLNIQGADDTNDALPLANLSLRLDPPAVSVDCIQALPSANDMASEKIDPAPISRLDGEAIIADSKDTSLESTTRSDSQAYQFSVEKTDLPDVKGNLNGNSEVRISNEEAKEDCFVEQIESRSPAKRLSRIEDSVEAIDKLEEEIEKAGQAITPPPTDTVPTPSKENTVVKVTKPGRNLTKASRNEISKANGEAVEGTNASKDGLSLKSKGTNKAMKRASIQCGSTDIKPKENRASLLRQGLKPAPPSRATRAPTYPAKRAHLVTKSPADSTKDGTSVSKITTSPARRVSSVTKPPFQPAKSSKPPTQSSFELPGEAISRKLKEQREERLRREEEEKSKKQIFKARPIRLSHAPEVRMTAATKIRLSIAKPSPEGVAQNSNKRPSPLASSVSSLSTNKRMSSLTIAKCSSPLTKATAKRVPSQSSVSGEPRAAPTADDLANQKFRGKEAFARPKNEIAAREKERKEKEEAAKRARIAAAERGRVASREWAEKQRAKRLADIALKQSATA